MVYKPIGYYPTTWSLSTLDDRPIPRRLRCYRTCYSNVIM